MPSEIYKFADGVWNAINEIGYQDGASLRDITAVHYNDSGTWRQVFGASVSPVTIDWFETDGTTVNDPAGIYFADSGSGPCQMEFRTDTSGNYNFIFITSEDASSTGTPTVGQYKGVIAVDASSYEISISAGTVSGVGTVSAIGSGTLINGTYQDLNTTRGVEFSNQADGPSGQVQITVEIREIADTGNTTGAATFTLKGTGTSS